MANIISFGRVALSLLLLLLKPFSSEFVLVYLLGGLTDILDGYVARKTASVSEFGAHLDTAADICFFVSASVKLFPKLNIPDWLWIWIGAIATVKLINIVAGLMLNRKLTSVHSVENKITGILLFVFPFTVPYVRIDMGTAVICAAATYAALREGTAVFREYKQHK